MVNLCSTVKFHTHHTSTYKHEFLYSMKQQEVRLLIFQDGMMINTQVASPAPSNFFLSGCSWPATTTTTLVQQSLGWRDSLWEEKTCPRVLLKDFTTKTWNLGSVNFSVALAHHDILREFDFVNHFHDHFLFMTISYRRQPGVQSWPNFLEIIHPAPLAVLLLIYFKQSNRWNKTGKECILKGVQNKKCFKVDGLWPEL